MNHFIAFIGALTILMAACGVLLNAPPNTEVLGVLSVSAATGFVGVAALLYAVFLQLAAIADKLPDRKD